MTESFMHRLREEIMPLHDEAEKLGPLSKIPEKKVTLEDYKRMLERLYGFVSVAEDAIEAQINGQCAELDYESRKRIGYLEKDLIFLGSSTGSIAQLPLCDHITYVQTLADALGVLYLFEGSRLGGLVLSKALRERFGFVEYRGYAYFGSNGLEVAAMWASFKDFMENYVERHGEGDKIINSAKKCFVLLNEWLVAV
ncbi:MAG: biliverdin-producing heme oxygenase [Deltaproteobacteria bacterium]|nr:biliverdin-producing heme oxygenase [Deltaproteobacteria bacterium]